ncbi:STAS domain-containing protein [Actinoplanes sp. CA-030573]|uniref:STAS domain-containing protein n=1 Tax=Actinoplanes sp. CA-030573 TaxID=3239898 RepID=UPI003D8FBE41
MPGPGSLIGELDQDTSAGLAGLIGNAALQYGVTELVVDLGHVTFLTAAGVRALVQACDDAASTGCAFRVANADGIALRVLAAGGLLDLFRIE